MRGDIYRLRAPRDAKGHEQQGRRFGVILQSDDLLLSTVIVAPTSTSARPASFRPEVEVAGVRTLVMIDQMSAVDPEVRLADLVGRLSLSEQQSVDSALATMLGLGS